MRNWISRIFLIAAMAAVAVPQSSIFAQQRERDRDDRRGGDRWEEDLPERDEFRQTYQLAAGARVELQGINGKADVETFDGNTAEVYIVRSAHTREDLNYHKIIVEASENSLVVRGENENERGSRHRGREVRQRVLLKIPRKVDFTAAGINGKVSVGQIDGPVKLSGINGKVDVAQAQGYSDISGINGKVEITVSQLGPRGINVSGVNGGVELRFTDELNADLEVTGNNGKVHADVPNVTIQGKMEPNNFRARIGAGGSPINVDGVNGRVRITRAGADR
jgi:hypothetical protein